MDNVKTDRIIEYMPIEEIKNKVLSHYNFIIHEIHNIKFKNTEKQRAVYKVITNKGPKCLKKVYYDEESLLFVYSVTEWLNVWNILCPRLISTKNGHKYIKYKGDLFIVTDWFDGRKCDYNDINDITAMAKNLARMHSSSKGFKPIYGSIDRRSDFSYFLNLYKHFNQLLENWNYAVNIDDSFSKLYAENFNYNYEKAIESLNILNKIDFSSQIGDQVSMSAICHLDYVNKNIIFTDNNSICVIDFDNSRLAMPVHDICYFIKRILKRDNTSWDFDIFKSAMNSYESIRQLSETEYKIIFAVLLFPQKYWKISRDYYKNRRLCNPNPFIDILKKTCRKQNKHNEFCTELRDYIQNRFSINEL